MFKLPKEELLKRLARGVHSFFPELTNHFICPTCLERVELPGDGKITVAHIIPQAAGGRLKTFLCKSCNSTFGSRQDKWFGETVQLKRSGKLLSTKIRERYYEIDGVRVNGSWKQTETGDFEFFIYKNLNPPEVLQALEDKFREEPHCIGLKFGLPVMANQKLADVGFLTAAYLTWFAVAGYSWAFQRHLDLVRQQILNATDTILPNRGVAYASTNITDVPRIGTMWLNGHFAVVVLFLNGLAVFPPADDQKLYERFPAGFDQTTATEFEEIRFSEPVYEGCFIYIRHHPTSQDRAFILPNIGEGIDKSAVLLFTEGAHSPFILDHHLTEGEAEALKRNPNVKTISIRQKVVES
ncbi:MAG: hypothetical protein HY651_00360 [Acidobacteria bacterium]|nr:hypothetical protein [Acidobacteriota bacterium]